MVSAYDSSDPDTRRIWWTDAGVHQNITFPVHPDPLSGMHCWHQAVRVAAATPGDRYGDIAVDVERSRRVFDDWLAKTRSATEHSPDGTRRPDGTQDPDRPQDQGAPHDDAEARAAYDRLWDGLDLAAGERR